MANHGKAYGFSAELEAKRNASYDKNLEGSVSRWISAVTGAKQSGSFQDWLKDGTVLCNLINKIKPGSVSGVKASRMPFVQMENIGKFLDAVSAYGLIESDKFMTVDLFEAKNMTAVVLCLSSLARMAANKGYSGPKLDVSAHTPQQIDYASEFGPGSAPSSTPTSAPARTTTTTSSGAGAGGGARFCANCGNARPSASAKFCANCGTPF